MADRPRHRSAAPRPRTRRRRRPPDARGRRALHRRWPRVELALLDRQSLIERPRSRPMPRSAGAPRPGSSTCSHWADPRRDPARTRPRLGPDRHEPVPAPLRGRRVRAPAGRDRRRTERFFACEPRRAPLALVGSHLVGALGANAVTREDAVLSVHAGFRDDELSRLWPGHRRLAAREYNGRALQPLPARRTSTGALSTRRRTSDRGSRRGDRAMNDAARAPVLDVDAVVVGAGPAGARRRFCWRAPAGRSRWSRSSAFRAARSAASASRRATCRCSTRSGSARRSTRRPARRCIGSR